MDRQKKQSVLPSRSAAHSLLDSFVAIYRKAIVRKPLKKQADAVSDPPMPTELPVDLPDYGENLDKPTLSDYSSYLDSVGSSHDSLNEKSPLYRIVRLRKFPDREIRKERLDSVLEKMIGNCDLTIVQLADSMAMDRATLHRWSNRIYFRSTTSLIQLKRIERAEKLLKEKKYPIEEIIAQCGFKSIKSFSLSIRKERNCTLDEFLEKYRE